MLATNFKDITKESYQATAQQFADNVEALAPMASIKQLIKFLPDHAKILDIGCGSGRDAKHFTDLGASVLGIDYCSNLLEIAKTKAPLADFQLMDIEAIDLPAESFDGAWAACSLAHIAKNNFPRVLNKIYSLLKKNGYFYMALKKGNGESLHQDTRYQGNIHKFWAYYETAELQEILNQSSFKIVEFAVIQRNSEYQTHEAFKVFLQKV